ncbi:MAG: four helix bundle protein [Cytophagaceae bacterium]|nr:four helix bundle protein [Cytophagaceae bacterium]
MHHFKNLKVWQMSMDLAENVYKITETFPANEKFGLISQINRSAVSVCSNIAAGAGGGSDKEFSNFLSITLGSSFELETQLILAKRLNYIDEEKFLILSNSLGEIQKMIIGLKNKLKKEFSNV